MNQRSVEIAADYARVFREEVSPVFEATRDRLLGALSTTSSELASLQQETEERKANMATISECLDLLPAPTVLDHTSFRSYYNIKVQGFRAEDPYTARMLKIYPIWASTGGSGFSPHYLIGTRPVQAELEPDFATIINPSKKTVSFVDGIFAHKPGKLSGWTLKTVRFIESDFQALQDIQGKLLAEDVPEEDIQKDYSENDGLLVIDPKKTRVLSITPQTYFSNNTKLVAKYGEIYGEKLDADSNLGLTDEDLVKFDVFDHLFYLATIFGKGEELETLLTKSAERSVPAPSTDENEDQIRYLGIE